MKHMMRLTSAMIFGLLVVAASTVRGGEVDTMPILEGKVEVTLHQCEGKRLPETDCLRLCFPDLRANGYEPTCVEVIRPWSKGVKE